TITPAIVTGITFEDGIFVYDASAKSLEIGGELPEGTSVEYSNNSRTDVGSQTVTATISGSNFTEMVLTAELTITPATVTGITFEDGSFVYDASTKSLAIEGELPEGTTVEYSNNSRTDVGTQEVIATISGSNFTELVLTAELTITPATITVITLENGSFVYDGSAKSLAIEGELPEGTSVAYTNNSRTNVGAQEVTARINGGNYTELVLTAEMTVNPATLTVTTNSGQRKVYGEADPVLRYTVSGFGIGDDEGILSGELNREEGEDVGIYEIRMGNLLVSSNYKIDFTAGIFNILPGKLEISDLNDIIEECSVSSLEAPVAKDGFGNEIVGVTDFELPFTQEGQYDIVWEFKSENHKTLQVIQLLIIEDNSAPVPDQQSLPEIIVECSISNIQPPTATDSCGGIILGTSEDPLSYNVPGEYLILWEFNDGNGNLSTQEQWVTVLDETAPNVVTRNITVYVSLDEPAVITAEDVDGGTTDNCSEVTLSIDGDTFDQPGIYQVILTATDESGNSAQSQATVEVKREGPDPAAVHVVPTILSGSTIAKVIMPFHHRIMEVQVLEVESKKYKMFPGNKSNELEINVAPLRGTLLVRIVDQTGKVYLKKLIVL
ncbi:MAG TPA: MBG domain-containing protein, partial [Gillisia sp.]|nr:MBG domain-containing protein [Gillisia sp.]